MRQTIVIVALMAATAAAGEPEWWKPYSPPCVERENVFAFTEKPKVKAMGNDKYEITFAVKGNCDVTVGIIDPSTSSGQDEQGVVVRHLASGVLGANAPAPFQKNSLKQTLYWNGKDDLDAYHKTPDKLKVRVMLGLKPVFDKRLGGTSPYNLPAGVFGIAVDSEGAYVFASAGCRSFHHCTVRKFGHNGEYLGAIFPPPASTPPEKLAGTVFIEYEPGKRAWNGPNLAQSLAGTGGVMADADSGMYNCQIALAGRRLVYGGCNLPNGGSRFFYVFTDGSTDSNSFRGRKVAWVGDPCPRLVASPDGKWLYAISHLSGDSRQAPRTSVFRCPLDGESPGATFIGDERKPGGDNEHFNGVDGIDCDAQGRIYVADAHNNRIQVFSPDGKYWKTIPVTRPGLLRVHQKTGAIYVQHGARVEGRTVNRLTKFTSCDDPKAEFYADGIASAVMAADSWSPKPRLWLGGGVKAVVREKPVHFSVRLFEENGKTLTLLRDFQEETEKEAGDNMVSWNGQCFDKVVCDPTREQAYYRNSVIFDLKTGKRLGSFATAQHCGFDDAAFDKHGFMHLHFNPFFFGQGVGRVDPARTPEAEKAKGTYRYPECPYDYGIEERGWLGILPTKDQCGPKGFQDGLGVNMKGDVASECNIYYVPKMDDMTRELAMKGPTARAATGQYVDDGVYKRFNREMEQMRRGWDEVRFIRRQPGIPLGGGTVWTFDRSGEVLQEFTVIAGELINGVQMDEDRSIYFVNSRPKAYDGFPFLYEKGIVQGATAGKTRLRPFTGTVIKTKPNQTCRVLLARAAVELDPLPDRPPDLLTTPFIEDATFGKGKGNWCWVEGAEWIYAGASPITSNNGCSCPRQHLGLDWYKRTYVPEGYRHSIGILDTNGNLIMHLGQYGNFDDAPGGKNGAKPGGENIGIMSVRFISATDNYLVFGDWAEKLVSLKLAYHAEEMAAISGQ